MQIALVAAAAVVMLRVNVQIATLQPGVRELGVRGSEAGLDVVMSRSQERLTVTVVCCRGMDLHLRDDAARQVFR